MKEASPYMLPSNLEYSTLQAIYQQGIVNFYNSWVITELKTILPRE